jgi:hypothetical protein
MTIIALSGYGTCGKDSVADILVNEYGFVKYAWADTLRLAAEALNPIIACGVDGEEIRYNDALSDYGYNTAKSLFPEFRTVLQRLGTEVGRNLIGDNVWVNATMRRIERERSLSDNIVVADTRFPNEAYAVQAQPESRNYVVRVHRPGVGPVSDHPSETSLDDFPFDFVVDNDGTLDDLGWRVGELMNSIEMSSGGLRSR